MKIIALLLSVPIILLSLPLDLITNKEEQEKMGISSLTSEQKKSLEEWVDNWTHRVISQAPTYHPSLSLKAWIHTWPEHLQPKNSSSQEVIASRKEANLRIFRNNRGESIELRDGSTWKIRQTDVDIARWWQRGTKIEVRRSKRDLRRPYILYNNARNEEVGASMMRSASQDGKRQEDPPEYFQNSISVEEITEDGIFIATSDEKRWKIAPSDQLQVQRQWQVQDRIRITRSSDAVFRYKITNLDSGDFVLANPEK